MDDVIWSALQPWGTYRRWTCCRTRFRKVGTAIGGLLHVLKGSKSSPGALANASEGQTN